MKLPGRILYLEGSGTERKCSPVSKERSLTLNVVCMLIWKLQNFDFYYFIFLSFNFSKTKYGTNIRLSCNNIKQCLMYSEARPC